jgi:preprotein translocase SecE subunit
MARQTRQQRRERRAETASGSGRRVPSPASPVAPESAGDNGRSERREPQQRRPAAESRRFAPIRFIQESWAELKKVEWPGQHQLIQGTTVVLIACAIVGAYLYANDVVWKHVVQKLIIK